LRTTEISKPLNNRENKTKLFNLFRQEFPVKAKRHTEWTPWQICSLIKEFFPPIVLGLAIAGLVMPAHAQNDPQEDNRLPGAVGFTEEELEKMVPAPRPEDVASPEAIVKALHDSVSGPKGDWNSDRFRSLCLPNVFFEYREKNGKGESLLSSISFDNIIKVFTDIHHKSGWYEDATDLSVMKIVHEGFSMASVRYGGGEGKTPGHKRSDNKNGPFTIVMYIGKRWWVVSHYW
jgi:hypothetical protein